MSRAAGSANRSLRCHKARASCLLEDWATTRRPPEPLEAVPIRNSSFGYRLQPGLRCRENRQLVSTLSSDRTGSDRQRIFSRIENSTLRGQIAEQIRNAILEGTLKPGSKVVERQLAAQFEISLTAVREALIGLEAEGFVTKKPNSATHVARLSLSDASKLFEVRRVLEGHAVELAASMCNAERAQELDEAYLALLDAAGKKHAALFVKKDLFLHATIWNITANEHLQSALLRINRPLFALAMIRLVADRNSSDLISYARSHAPLLEAIKSNDPDRARKLFHGVADEWLESLRSEVAGPD